MTRPDRAWVAISRLESPGYHFEFAALAILALARGLDLESFLDIFGVPELMEYRGATVKASHDPSGDIVIRIGCEEWSRGDAFDMGREFYSLVGFNQAPGAAWDALIAQVGEETANLIASTFCREIEP